MPIVDVPNAPKMPVDLGRTDGPFRGLAEHSLVGMAIVQDDRYLYVNPKLCEMFGYTRDELLGGMSPIDLVVESDRALAAENIRGRLQGTTLEVMYSLRGKRKDGSTIDVEIHGSRMEIGGRAALIANLINVTDRNRTMAPLQESGRQIRHERDTAQAYLDIAGVMILVLDRDGKVALINRRGCSILEYTDPKELIGKSWIDNFIPPRLRDEMRTAFARVVGGADSSVDDYENPVLTKNGTERLIAWHNAQIVDEKGAIVATLSSGEDVTERRRLDESLRLSEARFRLLFDEAPNAILVYDFANDRIIDANRQAAELFECGHDEILRLGLRSFYSPGQPDAKPVEATFFEHGRQALESADSHFERRIRTAKGNVRHCEVRLVRLPSPNEQLIRASYVDITEGKRADAKIREDETLFRALVDQSVAAIFTLRADLTLGYVNRHFVELLGYSQDEVLGRPVLDFIADSDKPGIVLAVQSLVSGRVKSIHLEAAVKSKSGAFIELLAHGAMAAFAGQPAVLGVAMDVTEQKRAQVALADSETSYRRLFESARDGILILDQQTRKILDVNPSLVTLLGYNREDFIGKRLWEIGPLKDVAAGRTAFETLQSEGYIRYDDLPLQASDSRKVDVEFVSTSYIAGGKRVIQCNVRDISERKKAEERARIAGIIVENSPTVLYRTFLNGDEKISYISENVARFGYQAHELLGTNINALIHPDDIGRVEKATVDLAMSGADSATIVYRVRHGDGTYLWVEDRTKVLRRPGGAMLGSEGLLVDITERKAAEEANAQLAAVVEFSRSAIVVVNLDGIITGWNRGAAGIFGYSAQQAIGQPLSVLGMPESALDIHKRLEEIERGDKAVAQHMAARRNDGRKIAIINTLSPIKDASGATIAASLIVLDISERKRADLNLQRATRALRTLSQGNAALVRAPTRGALFQEMCRVIVEVGGYRMAWVGLAQDDPGKTVRPVAIAGDDTGYVDQANISWSDDERGRGPTGTAIRMGKAQVNHDFASEPRMVPWRAEALKRGYASSVALPLSEAGRIFGALTIYASEPDAFQAEEVELLTELAGDVSYGSGALEARLAREAALKRLEATMEETIQVIASTVELRDVYTAGHQRRVAVVAEAIGREMGLPESRIAGLRLASIVHDLGKINIPAEILSKPGKLSALEYDLVKTHPKAGYDILKPVTFPWPIAEIVLQHHERLDGSGYPNGLKGDAILLEARIMAVADVVESMNSHRPYRPALGVGAALVEIQRGSGTLYDPAVVDSCLRLVRSGKVKLDA